MKKEEGHVKKIESLPSGVQGLGMGLPDMSRKKKGKHKVAKEDHVAEALGKLREQTRETVKGLESLSSKKQPTGPDDAMVEDWIKQFEDLTSSQVKIHNLSCYFLFCLSSLVLLLTSSSALIRFLVDILSWNKDFCLISTNCLLWWIWFSQSIFGFWLCFS